MVKTEILKFEFKTQIKENHHSVRFRGWLTNKKEKFDYLGSDVRNCGGIMGNVDISISSVEKWWREYCVMEIYQKRWKGNFTKASRCMDPSVGHKKKKNKKQKYK